MIKTSFSPKSFLRRKIPNTIITHIQSEYILNCDQSQPEILTFSDFLFSILRQGDPP